MQHLRLSWEERVESLKAGVLSAGSVTLIFPLIALFNDFLASRYASPVMNYWVSGAIVLFAGFLFGVTYRYIIREDQNSHLKSGAVLAFGLVRGLAQVELGIATQSSWVPIVSFAGESIFLFAIARLVLDGGMAIGWIGRFKG
ncbi:hypothetical protein [Leptolyngbya sp. FACHB-17]|uniref:hypothetical protein n=1 Tax=unclassified Leptolyngbya TaxID=2650499 RepID=UPI00168142CE|nr:hypothetical protein [Leptolyngbya sp. FACHB-17]MBD2082915.1 hypothetical protein [Leptolyngbya sp. FACHB-17]